MAKPAPATKTERRMYPDADATAPGGMSQAELRVELAEFHGVKMDASREMSWTQQIEAVIQGRLDREAEHGRGTSREQWRDDPTSGSATDAQIDALNEEYELPQDDDQCQHGEDPVLCEACEDALLGDGDDEDDIAAQVDAMIEEDPSLLEQAKSRIERSDAPPDVVIHHYGDPEADDSLDDLDPDQWFAEAETERDGHVAALPPSLFLGMPGVLDYSFNGHAGTGPSAADRWMNCTASLGASRRFLERLSQNQQHEFAGANMAARQGTTAHAAAEVEARVMLGELDANEAEHELFELAIDPPAGEEYTPEMAAFITEYTDLIKGHIDDGHEVLIEALLLAAVPLTAPLPKEAWLDPEDPDSADYYVIPGSGDCVSMPTEDEAVLTVIDLKYGEGKDVDPNSNPQVRIYGLGALAILADAGYNLDDLERIDYVIAQPRLGGIKVWTESVDDLLTWRDEVLSPALTAALGLAPSEYVPADDTCQWCPARGGCSALAGARVEAAAALFTALDEAEFGDGPGVVAADLDDERLGSLLTQITGLIDLQKDLKAEAQRRVYRGDKVPGWMLVNYTPSRFWKPEAAEFFADEDNAHLPVWAEPSLVSPTAFVKKMASEFKGTNAKEREAAAQAKFARLIEVPDKRPVVAPEGDRRSRWQGVAPDVMFPDLGDDE